MPKERRQSYSGPVEVWIKGAKRFDAPAQLFGYTFIATVEATEADLRRDGTMSWDGTVHGLDPLEVHGLLPEPLELRFPDGRIASAYFRNPDGLLRGVGELPFD